MERRALRRAVVIGATVMAVLIATDLGINLLIETPGAVVLAPFQVAAAAASGSVAVGGRRTSLPAAPLAILLLLLAVGVASLGLVLMPTGRLLGTAQIAILLVAAGLFLPWSQRWHIGGIGSAVALVATVALGPLATVLPAADRVALGTAAVMAGVTSVIGHGLWQARFRSMVEQQFALRHVSRYAQRQEAHASQLNRELNRVARRDPLTGVGNRLALDEAISALLDQGERVRPRRFALVLFDLDHFKAYNDEHGHLAGDAALQHLGRILRDVTRSDDRAFRYGGEEFLLLLPDVDLRAAIAIAERVRLAVAEPTIELPPFSVSGGVALCDSADGRDPAPLLRRADAALYLAKRAGRDRIAADELSVAMERDTLRSA